MGSVIASLAVYFFASFKAKKALTEFGIEGLARGLAAATLALAASCLTGWAIDAVFPDHAAHVDATDQTKALEQALGAMQAAQNLR